MRANYEEAARRHHRDAAYLLSAGGARRGNADQTYGLAAECALKAVMIGLGAPASSAGQVLERRHRVHIDRLWTEFIAFAGTRGGAAYAGQLPAGRPFADWSVGQRYAGRHALPTHSRVETHKSAADSTMRILDQAFLDGVVV